MTDLLRIADKTFNSRLMVGTGRHRSMEEMVSSITASEAEIITVAIGRLDLSKPNEKTILDYFDWSKYTVLPNTAGSVLLRNRPCLQQDLVGKSLDQTGLNWKLFQIQSTYFQILWEPTRPP